MSDINFNKPISKNESGVLAALWRNIIKTNNLTHALDYLVLKYISRSGKESGDNIRLKNKSTLLSNITAPEMSIKVFFDLLFNYLCVKKVSFTIKLTFINGDESVHTVNVYNSVCEVDVMKDIEKNINTVGENTVDNIGDNKDGKRVKRRKVKKSSK